MLSSRCVKCSEKTPATVHARLALCGHCSPAYVWHRWGLRASQVLHLHHNDTICSLPTCAGGLELQAQQKTSISDLEAQMECRNDTYTEAAECATTRFDQVEAQNLHNMSLVKYALVGALVPIAPSAKSPHTVNLSSTPTRTSSARARTTPAMG